MFQDFFETRGRFFVKLILFLVLSVLFANNPISAATENSIFTPYTKVTLENGLTIIVKEVHSAPIAAIDIRVAVGAVNESPDQAGISHFVEHMLFKGTDRRGVGEIAREIQGVGGDLNGATSKDTTHYYVMVPSDCIELALDVEADAIQNSAFDLEEIERERNVILEEIRLRQDNPRGVFSELVIPNLFSDTPYSNDVLGTSDTLNNIDRDALLSYYRKHYVPNNMVVAVVGDVDTKQVLNRLTELFKDFKPGEVGPSPVVELPKLKEVKRIDIEREVSQTYLYLGFPTLPLNSKDSAALEVLRVLLGGCKSAKLNSLYGERLIRYISTEYTTYRDIGLFGIYVETQNPAKVEQKVLSILQRVIKDGVTDKEMALAKAVSRTKDALETERILTLAQMMSEYEINGSVEDGVEYERRLEAVTVEDVQRVAGEYVNPDCYLLVTVKPKEAK
jgi:zinc protease